MENNRKRSNEDCAFNTKEKRLQIHHPNHQKLFCGKIVWKLNGQVTGITVNTRGPATAPAVEKKEAKRSIKPTCKAAKSWIGCSCDDGVDAGAQCHQPLSTPRCQGLRSKLLQMGVTNPVCCLRKKITKSDVDRGQHRLLLPNDLLNKPVLKGTLTADEERETVELSGLVVRTLDRAGREYKLTLRFVDSARAYRIIGRDYTRLVVDNGFRPGQLLDLLVFRVPTQNEFAMALIEYDKAEDEASLAAAAAQDIEMVNAAESMMFLRMALECALDVLKPRQRDAGEEIGLRRSTRGHKKPIRYMTN